MNEKVMVVDDSWLMLSMVKKAICDEFDVFLFEDVRDALKNVEIISPDLIILDINMPYMSGFEFFDWIKKNDKTTNIPVIFLSSADRNSSEMKAIESGAMDYISKPFTPVHLKKRVQLYIKLMNSRKEIERKNQELELYAKTLQDMVSAKTNEILALRDAIVYSIGDIVESRDRDTGGHIRRTAEYVRTLANSCVDLSIYSSELSSDIVSYLVKAAPLHDIGKIEISDIILLKTGKLNSEEFDIMKTHAYLGYQIIKKISYEITNSKELELGMEIALNHHEKWNGTGYPNTLQGRQIPLSGRLMAIADVYDALVTARPYKKKFSHQKALEIIISEAGGHFDPKLVNAFLSVHNEFKNIATQYTTE